LLNLDHLRQGINLRAFGQRDPLNEYKTEAFAAFSRMLDQMRESITQLLCLVEINQNAERPELSMPGQAPRQPMQETRQDPALMGTSRTEMNQQRQQQTNVRRIERSAFSKDDPDTWGKVQRNADCPCGSGKKFKHCHGQLVQKA
jgi:preprotein translocase subunit SecA